jgi:hypothetical protein
MNRISTDLQKIESFILSSRFHYLLISIGIVIRLRQYLFNRNLWVDEAMIALNVIQKNFHELLRPLDYVQVSPIGFLYLQKVTTLLLGSSEYAFRFWPFVFGVASIFAFYFLLRKTTPPLVTTFALAIFVFSFKLVYYSSEFKQYSLELLLAIILYAFYFTKPIQERTPKEIWQIGIIGAISCWFSFTIIFVMFTLGLYSFYEYLKSRNLITFLKQAPMFSMWVGSFGIYYFSIISKYSGNQVEQVEYWILTNKFMPLQYTSQKDFLWYFEAMNEYFRYTVGAINLESLLFFFLFFGAVYFIIRQQFRFLSYFAIIVLMMLASAFHILPFTGRILLFTSAGAIILIVAGIYFIAGEEKSRRSLFYTCIALVLFQPIFISIYQLLRPNVEEEITPAIEYILLNSEKGDELYVNYFAEPAFRYYQLWYQDLNSYPLIWGVAKENKYQLGKEDIDLLQGKGRVWIVNNEYEENLLSQDLDKIGRQLDLYSYRGGRLFLYQFD